MNIMKQIASIKHPLTCGSDLRADGHLSERVGPAHQQVAIALPEQRAWVRVLRPHARRWVQAADGGLRGDVHDAHLGGVRPSYQVAC